MDPDQAWSDLLQALASGDDEASRQLAEDLRSWLNRGGFTPQIFPQLSAKVSNPASFPVQFQRELVAHACDLITARKPHSISHPSER